MDTQWRTAGMNGVRVGLDYGVLFARLDRMGLSRDDWEQMFNDVRVLEFAAINRMTETAA